MNTLYTLVSMRFPHVGSQFVSVKKIKKYAAASAILLSILSTGVSQIALAAAPPPLPTGNNGIAANYPGDANISSAPNVIYADNFESYSASSPNWLATGRWNNKFGNVTISGGSNAFAGSQGAQMVIPANSSDVSAGLQKYLSPKQDTIFFRFYEKFMSGYSASGSEHNGALVSANYQGPGIAANGTNHFESDVENSCDFGGVQPCYTNSYNYYVGQRGNYGDHWYPDGTVEPVTSVPGDFGPYFVPRPQFVPQLNRWYSYELMVHANTPGSRDGRVAVWIDGNLIGDWQNIVFRTTNTLQIDLAELGFYLGSNPKATAETIWYDNVVMAKSYIGPMSSGGTVTIPAAPTGLTATVH